MGVGGVLEEIQQRIRTQVVNPQLSMQFVKWIRANDQRRNIDCRSVFPEYEDVLADYVPS